MDSVLRALSLAMRLCSVVLSVASSVGAAVFLQPEKASVRKSAVTAARVRGVESEWLAYMRPLFLHRA